MTRASLRRVVASGEGLTLEFKRSTGELREGLETLCGLLNAEGGRLLCGVNRKGGIEGQQVSEQTLNEIAAALQQVLNAVASLGEASLQEIRERLYRPPTSRMVQRLLAKLVEAGRVVRTGKGPSTRYRLGK